MTTSLECIVRELNVKNGQSIAASSAVLTYQRQDAVTSKAMALLSGVAGGPIAALGSVTIRYNRQSLSELFDSLPTTLTLVPATSIVGILTSLRRNYGVALSPSDVIDGPVVWTDGSTEFTLAVKPNSAFQEGSVTIRATAQTMSLSTVFRTLSVDVSTPVTPTTLVAALNAVNGVYVPTTALTVGPVAENTAGTLNKNSHVSITAVPDSGYVGSVNLYYDRFEMAWLADMGSLSVKDEVVTGRDLVPYLVALKGAIVVPSDVQNTIIDYSSIPSLYVLTASSDSYSYRGSVSVDVKRRSDYATVVTVNITADDLAFTKQKLVNLITPQIVANTPHDVVINVGTNVTIVGASAANPTLALDAIAGVSDLRYFINNHGSIYGRGGNGGTAAGSAVVGFPGGDAINVSGVDVPVFIDNQGRVMGGGGGGGCVTSSGVRGLGGGGAPFGLRSDGAATTLTSYLPGTTSTNYPIQSNGGRGGDVGQDGGTGTMYFTSSGSLGYTTAGGVAGKVISGVLGKVTWLTKGLRLPFQSDDVLPTGITAASIVRTYPDPRSAKMLTVGLGAFSPGSSILTPTNLSIAAGVNGIGAVVATSNYHTVFIDGKFLLLPIVSTRTDISYAQLYAAGLVDGDGTTGHNPPSGAPLVVQRKVITYNGQNWSIRLMGGANNDPVGVGDTHVGVNTTDTVNSEWNRLMYALSSSVFADQPDNKWASFADSPLGIATTSPNKGYVLTKERHNYDGTDRRVTRGGGETASDPLGIGISRIGSAPVASTAYQWHPVLELVA